MNQIFSSNELIRLVNLKELEEYGCSEDEFQLELDSIFTKINDRSFDFEIQQMFDFYSTNNLSHKVVLRKLNDNIKRLYKDEQANRRLIICQIKTLLEETCPSWILRTDIKKFYESIKRDRIIARLKNDAMLSYQSIYLLEKLFAHPILSEKTGLPRGISISSTLSELYMRKFDKWIKRYPGVYYYARFVDDIIVFANSSETIKNIKEELNEKLMEFADGLEINYSKTDDFLGNYIREVKPLDYLGYKFVKNSQKKNEKLIVTISDKKVKRIKTRIVKALLDYSKNLNFELLIMRIRFLTGNYSIRKCIDGNDLRAGIFYNYSEINDFTALEELNVFMNKAIHSRRGSFGNKINSSLSKEQKKRLCSHSFKYGYLNKVFNSFTYDQIKSIIRCWYYGKS